MPEAPYPHDHAVVIAVRRYADVAAGWITALEGPDNDAAAIAAWLRRPDGGGLPEANVRVVRAADADGADGRALPDQPTVIGALDEIAQLPKGAYDGQYAGRRLYVYVSGHGWANEPDEAALLTAEATRQQPLNVLVTSWTRWMHLAAPFREIVLWVDTCATREPLALLQPCVLERRVGANHPQVRLFEGFAAPLGLKAVEREMPDGRCHGVFTYALLQGLDGAAPRPLTSHTLSDWMRNAMRDFMREDQRASRTVAQEPAFGRRDPIEFPQRAAARFPVTLRFSPAHVGRRVEVGAGGGAAAVAETVLQAPEWTLELESGGWLARIEGTGGPTAFEVTGGGPVDVAVA